ncbi:hypothetical protein C8R43DRAFT_1116257 [Mycena crocata]|nr:hypothetical protein C8R43DRAFT_1116257 [Mycena crocata]
MNRMGKKRTRARVPKADRRNLRNWAEGAREAILTPHIEAYADATEKGWRSERDYFARVCNEFHQQIDWRLEDYEEPELPLADFDPHKRIDPEPGLSQADQKKRLARMDLLDARIRRWLKYRVKRLRKHVRTRIDSSKDPWAILLAKLSGVTSPPKARQAYQQFMVAEYATTIEPVVQERWAETAGEGASVPVDKEPNAPFRAKVARELFAELPEETRLEYGERAKSDAAKARDAYTKALKEAPSRSPEARHLAIENVGSFVAPILQGIHERTGLHSVLILGGPIPKYGGDLRTIHVSYGRNRTSVGSHFPQYAKDRFNGVLALMKEYLDTVFSKEDCLDSALPTGLDGAKFTISNDASSSESSSDSDSSSDESDDDESNRPKKKKKTASQQKSTSGGVTQSLLRPYGAKSQGEVGGEGASAGKKRKAGEGDESGSAGKKRKEGEGEKASPEGKKGRKGKQESSVKVATGAPAGARRPPARGSARRTPAEPKAAGTTVVNAAASSAATNAGTSSATAPSTPVIIASIDKPAEGQATPVATATAFNITAGAVIVPPIPTSTDPIIAPTTPSTTVGTTATPNPPPTPPPTNTTTAATPSSTPTTPDPPPTPPPIDTTATPGSATTTTPGVVVPALTAVLPFAFEPDAPAWLRDSVRVLTCVDLGCHYHSLVEALIRVEHRFGFKTNPTTGIKREGRPDEVSRWISAGRALKRKGAYDAEITDLDRYATTWRAWWDSLQPSWRKRAAAGDSWHRPDEYDKSWAWDELWFPGQNGCLSLVAGLYFWGAAKQALSGDAGGGGWTVEQRHMWEEAILDTVWMVEGLEQALPAPKKRTRQSLRITA